MTSGPLPLRMAGISRGTREKNRKARRLLAATRFRPAATCISVPAIAGSFTQADRRGVNGWPMLGSSRDLIEVLGRVASRDRDAFQILYGATSAKLYGIVIKILREHGLADEILQDVYLKIWERAGDFDAGRASPITWMATIARNRALDELRRGKVLPTTPFDEDTDLAMEAENALEAMERTDRLKALMACLDALGQERRDLILLAYYRGLSREALARRLDRPVATIKTWLHRGLTQLRGCLAQ